MPGIPGAYEQVMSAQQRIEGLFRELYGDGDSARAAWHELASVLARHIEGRPSALRVRDSERQHWFLSGDQIGYSCYADRFGGTLRGVQGRIPHLLGLGVTYLHLLPVFRTQSEQNDGGFAVAAYDEIEPRLGVMRDLRTLADELHQHGIGLCLDFIANHTSRHHAWAQKVVQGRGPYDSYYCFLNSEAEVAEAEASLDDVFPQSAPGNFVYVPERAAWVWSTFQAYQWDLNYANPWVLVEMVDALLFLANQGVDALRVDSAPFLWKEIGTSCRGRPQTHLILQLFRAVVDFAAPSVVLLAEAIVSPQELVRYLGAHEPPVLECHIAYQGVLMPMLWHALATGDGAPLLRVLRSRVDAPAGTTWLQYVRSHDNIEWAVLSSDLLADAGLEPRHIEDTVRFLHGDAAWSFSDGKPFEGGLGTRLSTNGTTASLCGLGTAATNRDRAAAIDRILLMYGILYALPGFPVIFGGDELAMLNDEGYADRPAQRSDSRWLHRPFLDWDVLKQEGPALAVLTGLQRLAKVRQAVAGFDQFRVPDLPAEVSTSLVVLERRATSGEGVTILGNLGDGPQRWRRASAEQMGLVGPGIDLISGRSVDDVVLEVGPYAIAWYRWGH